MVEFSEKGAAEKIHFSNMLLSQHVQNKNVCVYIYMYREIKKKYVTYDIYTAYTIHIYICMYTTHIYGIYMGLNLCM